MRSFLQRLCFILFFANISFFVNAQHWPYLAVEDKISDNGVSNTSIITADVTLNSQSYMSIPHLAYTENKKAKVKRYVEGIWESVGGEISVGNTSYTNLFADDKGKLYLSYADELANNKLAVKTFNIITNNWEPLGNNNDNLYLSTGSIIQNIGSALNSAHNSWMAFDSNNIPYVVFSDFGNSGRPEVKKFNGTSWVNVGASPIATDKATSVGIAFDSNGTIPYIVYEAGTASTGTIKLHKFNGISWQSISVPEQVVSGNTTGQTTGTRHSNIVIDNDNNVYIAYFNSGNANKATVIKYQTANETWTLSQILSTRDSPNITAVKASSGALYISFADLYANNSGRTVARVFKLPLESNTWVELKNNTVTDGVDEPTSFISIAAGVNGNEYMAYSKNSSAVVRTFSAEAPPAPEPVEPDVVVSTPKQMEFLRRGLTAVRTDASKVLVTWRFLGTDPSSISFNLYRNGTLLNSTPISNSTNYLDNTALNGTYVIKEVIDGVEVKATKPVSVWITNYLKIQLDQPAGGTTPDNVAFDYAPMETSIGDADGDGEYELFVKWEPSNYKDNSEKGYTGNVFIDCYKLDGTKLWRVDLGRNIRAGAHYTQFMVYDFDGDGKAEMACKTADATIDGTGTVIGNISADYRNSDGYILSGPEFLTMFNGQTGKAISTVNYLPARGTVSSWGDNYGNRVDRFVSAVAYLDGEKPSLIMGRGYYTRMVRVAWDFVGGELKQRWIFDSNSLGNNAYAGQGNHQMSIADVDGDGKQEIINGSSVINDNGKGLWTDGKGHGDALHVTDMDPSRPGLEIWMNHEEESKYTPYGLRLRDAKNGETIFGVTTTGDIGRCMVGDIDPNYPGYEVWGAGGVYSMTGAQISTRKLPENFGIWWDGDLSREILDGIKIDKWNPITKNTSMLYTMSDIVPVSSSYTTKAVPCLSADILGDWREEVILWGNDKKSLYLFTTPHVTDQRVHTLMHDAQYRTAIAWQNSAYNQPPYPSFFLGNGMNTPAAPLIYTAGDGTLPVSLLEFKAKADGNKVVLNWKTASETNNKSFIVERSADAKRFEPVLNINGVGTTNQLSSYSAVDYNPLKGESYYRLNQLDFNGASSTSNIQSVKITLSEDGFLITPNPVNNYVQLTLNSNSEILHLMLTSVDGRMIINQKGTLLEINREINKLLSTLSPGTYVITLEDVLKSYSKKMIKQ